MEELKSSNSDLETRAEHLQKTNEKLADDEGRWYSLARELENQMDVIKEVRTPASLNTIGVARRCNRCTVACCLRQEQVGLAGSARVSPLVASVAAG